MKRTKRTDIHRPTVINADDYEFVGFDHMKFEGLGSVEAILAERERIKAHMARTGGNYSGHEHGGNCMVCGNANALYTTLWYHAKTNAYVRTGKDCADKMGMSCGSDFNAFRAAVNNALEAKAGKAKAAAILEAAGLSEAWAIYNLNCRCPPSEDARIAHCVCRIQKKEERTIRDIVSGLIRYGSISEPASKFIGTLLSRIADRPALEQKRAEERAAAADCPSGRVKLSGRILSLKVVDTDFGPVTKMLLLDDRGFKVYGSRPSFPTNPAALEYDNPERGDRIEFFAAVEPSRDDVKFGFYKRPTKGKVIERSIKDKPLSEQERNMRVYFFTTPDPSGFGFWISGIINFATAASTRKPV